MLSEETHLGELQMFTFYSREHIFILDVHKHLFYIHKYIYLLFTCMFIQSEIFIIYRFCRNDLWDPKIKREVTGRMKIVHIYFIDAFNLDIVLVP